MNDHYLLWPWLQGYVSIWAPNQISLLSNLNLLSQIYLEIWKHLAEKFSSIKKSLAAEQPKLFASARCRLHSRFWVRQFRSIWVAQQPQEKPKNCIVPGIKFPEIFFLMQLSILRWKNPKIKENIARGAMDPGYWLYNLNHFYWPKSI